MQRKQTFLNYIRLIISFILTVPLGYRQFDGEPYGLMIAGTAWSEAMLLRVAHGFEQASHVRDQRRPLYAERD